MFLHGMGSGSCLSYTGLVLPEHTSPDSDQRFSASHRWCLIFLTSHRWYLVHHMSDWWICRQTGLSQWAPLHFALEFFWVLRALGSYTAQVGLPCKNSSYYSNVSLAWLAISIKSPAAFFLVALLKKTQWHKAVRSSTVFGLLKLIPTMVIF